MTLLAVVGVAAAVTLLHIEQSMGLPSAMPLLVVGFVIHSLLPLRFRLPFFLGLGGVGALQLFGPWSAAFLVGSGLALFGACHLPIPYRARLVVVAVLTAALAVLRLGFVQVPAVSVVVPVLASFFMFRLMLYLYDLPNERKPASLQLRLAYFFLFPNLWFPLFPVVDYQRFKMSHYATDADGIHRKGVAWMWLGTAHILIYRGLHLFLIPDASGIHDLEGVVLYVLTAYLQYLRISGMFHLAAGMVCLFGFDLPVTNRWFFFATSYSDLWRRINIYWKDFLQKLVYFPVFMRYRKASMERGVLAATMAVFVGSWALHAWQWFWLQGEVLITDVDLAFWGLVGGSVVVSTLFETRKGKAPEPRSPGWEAVVRTGRTAFVFVPTCFMWSLWNSDSLEEWWFILGQARHVTWETAGRLGVGAFAAVAGGVGLWWLTLRGGMPDLERLLSRGPVLLLATGGLVSLGVAAPLLPDDSPALALALEPDDGPIGYYEGLMKGEDPNEPRSEVPEAAGEVWEREIGRGWDLYEDPDLVEPVDDLRRVQLRRSVRGTLNDMEFRTNEHGMRDDEVSLAPTPGVLRVALLGASPEMGWGVANGEDYPAVLDEMLGPKVEILNFGMAGFGPVQQVLVLDEALAFEPDVVMLVSHCRGDFELTQRLLLKLSADGPPYPQVLDGQVSWDVGRGSGRRAALTRQVAPLTQWAYEQIATRSVERGALPVWVYLRLPNSSRCAAPSDDDVRGWAENAGFRILRLAGLYRGHNQARLSMRGAHPTPEAHQLIATGLAEMFTPVVDELQGKVEP